VDWVQSAAFSPDGATIVTASDDWTAQLWDAATGAALSVLSGHRSYVRSAAFNPDGKTVVTASSDGTARIWIVGVQELLNYARRIVPRPLTDNEGWQFGLETRSQSTFQLN